MADQWSIEREIVSLSENVKLLSREARDSADKAEALRCKQECMDKDFSIRLTVVENAINALNNSKDEGKKWDLERIGIWATLIGTLALAVISIFVH